MSAAPDSRGALIVELCNALIASPVLSGMPHLLALEVLINLYVGVAESHPCCRDHAAQAAFKAYTRLSGAPDGASFH